MTQKVPYELIEAQVGANRHPTLHLGRAVSGNKTFFILHPDDCLALFDDLRDCPFSLALDRGVDFSHEDEVLVLSVHEGYLLGMKK